MGDTHHIFFTWCLVRGYYLADMSEKVFKKGDRVREISDHAAYSFMKGREYTVKGLSGGGNGVYEQMVLLEEDEGTGFVFSSRFELAPAVTIDEEITACEKRLNELHAKRANAKYLEALEQAYTMMKAKLEGDPLFRCDPRNNESFAFGTSPRVIVTLERR